MNILICDDDKRDIARLRSLIEQYDGERHIGAEVFCYERGKDFLAGIAKHLPDIIFLDINMEDMDGLKLAEKVRERNEEVPIILVTAYMSYALDGYKVRANRFLVKDDLDKTFTECMDDICRQLKKKSKNMVFACVEGDVDIKLAEIIYIEITGHKSVIHLKAQDYQIYESMDDLEDKLKPYGFLRVHQSFLVNMKHIRSINSYMLTLDTGVEIRIPKARYKKVKVERALYVGKSL
ncbi:MAG: response regulator transcription factor [Oribacterium sp.]|nr:response regulator transcription factor [Oribacterium sp.]